MEDRRGRRGRASAGWIIYGRVEHYLLASSVDQLSNQSQELDKAMPQAVKDCGRTADIAKWADEDANGSTGFTHSIKASRRRNMCLNQLTASASLNSGEINDQRIQPA